MEATREIYWNVGHGVLLPMYLFTLLAFAALGYGFYRRVEVYRKGKALNRLDDLGLRLTLFLKNLFGQFKVMRVPGPGSRRYRQADWHRRGNGEGRVHIG